jgi:hypothetical protein
MSVGKMNNNPLQEGRSDETFSRAFRLNKTALDALHQEAKKGSVTINTIVNELVMKHIMVDRILEKYHPVTITSAVLKLFTEGLSEDRIIEIAEETANDVFLKNFPAEATGDDSTAGILQTLKDFPLVGGEYEYSEDEYGGKKIVILVHDVGKNWSLFIATYWKNLLSQKGLDVKISATEKAAVLQFRQSDINAVNHPAS